MPNKDWMWPNWQWSRTWRWLWNCAKKSNDSKWNNNQSDQENTTPNFGRNSNIRRWIGRGWRNQWSWRWNPSV